MSNTHVVAVVGATGTQGGGLVRALLADEDRQFAVRALTRNPSGLAASALATRGVEVVAADLDDEHGLAAALEGARSAFFVTNFWEHLSPTREQRQAHNLARAAAAAGIEHAVWSTLEDTREFVALDDPRMPTLLGGFTVPHFDGKGAADAFFRAAGVPTTFLRTSFYWENLLAGFGLHRGPSGLVLTLPMADKRLAGVAAEDIGRTAHGVLREGERAVGRTIGVAGEHLTGREMAAVLAEVLGEQVTYAPADVEAFRSSGVPGAQDAANMFRFYQDFEAEVCGARDVATARRLNPRLLSFRAWAEANTELLRAL